MRLTSSPKKLRPHPLSVGGRRFDFSKRAYIDGILNVTPDSFYDGGKHSSTEAAVAHGLSLWEDGADILEIGGEAAGPGIPNSEEAEIKRIVPVIEALAREVDVPISIDTYKYRVAEAAVVAGATIINDTQSLLDPRMALLAARYQTALVLMHFPGMPRETPREWRYRDLMGEVCAFLTERAEQAVAAGVPKEKIILDPGIGFHKTDAHDLEVMRRLPEMVSLGFPIMLGTSHRGFIGYATGLPLGQRLEATLATVAFGVAQGAHIIRVHNVKEAARVVHMMAAMMIGRPSLAKG